MRYTREGGLRSKTLARLTNGKFGLGRWTQAEIDSIKERAEKSYLEFRKVVDDSIRDCSRPPSR